jgi:hypothetical protein
MTVTADTDLQKELDDANAKVDEFRDHNRSLNAAKTELEGKLIAVEKMRDAALEDVATYQTKLKVFDGVDVPALQASLAEAVTARDAHVTTIAALEQKVTTLEARPDLMPKVAELETALAAAHTAHAQDGFKHAVGFAALKHHVQPATLEFVVGEAKKTFALQADGSLKTTVFSKVAPGEHLSIDEWLEQQAVVNPWLFMPSKGGGANGGAGPSQRPPERKVVDAADAYAFGQNLQAIADGRVDVK